MEEGYIYLLQSLKDQSYYFGSTKNINQRLIEHNAGKSASTKNKRPWKLVCVIKFDDLSEARRIEQVLKSYKKTVNLRWFLETTAKIVP